MEAQEKMASLSDRAEKDVQQHNAEIKESIRVIYRDRRLREFMNAKSKVREEDQQLVAWRVRKGLFYNIHLFVRSFTHSCSRKNSTHLT